MEPGEIVVLEPGREPVSVRFAEATPALCVFELIYFARPDSYMEGRNLYEARRHMGMQLASEHPVEADLVMPVPDTGAPAAAGFAEASGIPYREGMVRNRYSGRTFIQPSQAMRQRGVNVKLSPLREVIRDQRLIVVDDSIVRGTTTKQIVGLLRRNGAKEVHLRISAAADLPPVLLRHRHLDRDRAHRLDPLGRGDPRLRRRRLAGLPVHPRRPRGARPAVRPVLLRLLRRRVPGAGAVRRRGAQVHPRGADRERRPVTDARAAYARAGVDVAAGERAVELMRASVASTRRPEVLGGLGGFGSAVAIPPGYREPVIVSSTDGVGTKTAIAQAMGRLDTIGIDLVAMCADDVVCTGAEPVAFLDYIAIGRLDPERVATLVAGIAEGCRQAGAALVGGETAEHPGLMEPDAWDLAGFCIGRRGARRALLDGSAARAGDVIVGLASSGLHANGYSLVRALVARPPARARRAVRGGGGEGAGVRRRRPGAELSARPRWARCC